MDRDRMDTLSYWEYLTKSIIDTIEKYDNCGTSYGVSLRPDGEKENEKYKVLCQFVGLPIWGLWADSENETYLPKLRQMLDVIQAMRQEGTEP